MRLPQQTDAEEIKKMIKSLFQSYRPNKFEKMSGIDDFVRKYIYYFDL